MSEEQLELSFLRQRRPPLATLQPIQSEATSINDVEKSDGDDIYRGERVPSPRPSTPTSIISSSSSSSSSGSVLAGGPLGALASVVEQAITKWARNARGSSSSSSSSTSSLRSSKSVALRPSLSRRRGRRSSVSSLHSVHSEREIAARITRMKALEEFRQVPREFILYLPPALGFARTSRRATRDLEDEGSNRVIKSSSISLILNQLDITLKKAAKNRRNVGKAPFGSPRHSRGLTSRPVGQSRSLDLEKTSSSSISPPLHKERKGKQREGSGNARRLVKFTEAAAGTPKAWFLDVASPTWEDLRAIGKLLHLHPLTLEDILQQEPREKLDLFPRLGYYFVSFRAIETREGRESAQRRLQRMNERLEPIAGLREGSIGETYVYLVVFSDGICCFHYNDVAEHTERVRNRISLLEDIAAMSSDWIAHGILDSIVDSFFPYLEEIEREVMAIEDLVFSPTPVEDATNLSPADFSAELARRNSIPQSPSEKRDKLKSTIPFTETISLSEKSPHLGGVRPRFAAPRWTLRLILRRFRRFWSRRWRRRHLPEAPPSATALTLRRMARVRRLVTSLSRLLSSKSEVITQIRKRLLRTGVAGLVRGTKVEALEVAMYMGDIQDHILTLQHSLAHYERMLSQSHPTYLLQLRTIFAGSKANTDETLVFLTSVSMAVLAIQLVTSAFSMNVHLPKTPDDFRMFGGVIAMCVVTFCVYTIVVAYWWRQAGKRRISLL